MCITFYKVNYSLATSLQSEDLITFVTYTVSIVADWFVDVQDRLEQQASLAQRVRWAVLDSQGSQDQLDRLAVLEAQATLVSKAQLDLRVIQGLMESSDGRDRVDRKAIVARQVQLEIRDCLVLPDLPDCRVSRDLLVAQAQQEVVGTLVQLVSRDLLVLPAHKVKLDLLDQMDSPAQTVQLASLEEQV